MIIGVTGVFGSGKTTVSNMFLNHCYLIINADEVGHRLLNREDIKKSVVKQFGEGILTDGLVDRSKLKEIVFHNSEKLKELNKMHPEIIKEIKRMIKESGEDKVVVDGALLIEAKGLSLVDKLIVVKIDRHEQIRRALKKGKYNREEIENIIKSQLSQEEKLKYADYVVDNSGDLVNTEKQVEKII